MYCSVAVTKLNDQLSEKQKEIDALQAKIDLTLVPDEGKLTEINVQIVDSIWLQEINKLFIKSQNSEFWN